MSKIKLFFLSFLMLVYLMIAGSFLYQRELSKLPEERQLTFDVTDVYQLYVKPKRPDISHSPFYGSPDATITIVAYLDIDSDATKFFIEDVFPQLKEEFIKIGKVRYYQKSYITEEDFRKNSNKFRFAKTLGCILKINKEAYYDFYFDFIKSKKEIAFYMERYNISEQLLDNCMHDGEVGEIMEDISEIKRLNMLGIKQRLYLGIEGTDNQIFDGIPTYRTMRKAIGRRLFEVGDGA